jgi:hypothetical protein
MDRPFAGAATWAVSRVLVVDIHKALIRSPLNFTTTFLAARHELPAK